MHGAVYTPQHIVNNILDLLGYEEDVLKKHIIDNSCGDGAFLVEVVRRYIANYFKNSNNIDELRLDLEKYIHGLEIDSQAVKNCHTNLDEIASQFGVSNVNWDVHMANTLDEDQYDGKMDYVVGNPPYIRVHNLQDNYERVKKFSFASNGMTDLFIVFFEIGFRMLSNTGKLGLITPSSFLRSRAGLSLRKYFQKTKGLSKIVDLGHYQAFNATTYTMISIFENSKHVESIEYYIYDSEKLIPKKIENLDYKVVFVGDSMFFSTTQNLLLLHEIDNHFRNRKHRSVIVKNGFATLADDVFIGDFAFHNCQIDVIKASTGKWTKCIFPYDSQGKPLSLDNIRSFPDIYQYLLRHKEKLLQRDSDDNQNWFLFGRSQAIQDVYKNKIAINTTIRDLGSIKLNYVEAGKGLYSGLYILSDHSFSEIQKTLMNDEFINYLSLLKNYKSGGYFSFSSIELEKYLSFKLEEVDHGQPRLFECHFPSI